MFSLARTATLAPISTRRTSVTKCSGIPLSPASRCISNRLPLSASTFPQTPAVPPLPSTSPLAKPFIPRTVTNSRPLQSKRCWPLPASRRRDRGRTRNISSPSRWRPLFDRRLNSLAPILPALAAALAQQRNFANANPLVERLCHVVDRKRRNRSRRHRLHLDPCARHGRCRSFDRHAALHYPDLHIDKAQREWMAHRNQVGGLLRRLNSGKARDLKRISFRVLRERRQHRLR